MTEPLGAAKRGSWLVSARKSYLELLLRQIDSTSGVSFGFSDVQSKLVYDVADRQRLELSLVAGRSRLEQQSEPGELGEVDDGRNSAQLVDVAWRFTPSKSFTLTERVAFAANRSRNAWRVEWITVRHRASRGGRTSR